MKRRSALQYITDAIQLVDILNPYTDEIWIYGLSVEDPSGQNWLNVQKILSLHFSDLMGRIEGIHASPGCRPFGGQRRNNRIYPLVYPDD